MTRSRGLLRRKCTRQPSALNLVQDPDHPGPPGKTAPAVVGPDRPKSANRFELAKSGRQDLNPRPFDPQKSDPFNERRFSAGFYPFWRTKDTNRGQKNGASTSPRQPRRSTRQVRTIYTGGGGEGLTRSSSYLQNEIPDYRRRSFPIRWDGCCFIWKTEWR